MASIMRLSKPMRRHVHLFLCLLLVSLGVFGQEPEAANVQTVRGFIAAFNAHDSEAMSRFVTEDVQWLSINGDSISTETNGKAALIAAMNDYFAACPTCQSHLDEMIASHERVSAIEVATWRGKDGPRTQKGVCVYEFSAGLIKRVYYFPAER